MTAAATPAPPLAPPAAARPSDRPRARHTVSVVVPCFNYARYLPAAVGSALAQQHVDVEVVVVDDASTDDSARVARALAAADPRVTVLRNETNRGPVATFNRGLAVATGEFLIRLDADDLLTPGSAARAVALAEAHPGVGLVYGHPVHFEGTPPPRFRHTVRGWRVIRGADWLDRRCRLGVNCITSPEVLMRTAVVDRLGGQRELAHTHDMELWLRIARATDVGIVDGCDQAWHREHSASLSATGSDVMTDLRERAAAFELLLGDGCGDDPAEDAGRLEDARRALADEALRRFASASAAGRGASAETRAFEDYARSLGPRLPTLPSHAAFALARRAGRSGSRRSPRLLLWAAGNRLRARWRTWRWTRSGL